MGAIIKKIWTQAIQLSELENGTLGYLHYSGSEVPYRKTTFVCRLHRQPLGGAIG